MKREDAPGAAGETGLQKEERGNASEQGGVCKGPRVGGAAGGLLSGGPVRYALLGNLAAAERRACWRRWRTTIGLHGADDSVC